jgi:hypothetical protein
MKKSITILGAIVFASVVLTSCGGNSSQEASSEAPAVTTEETASPITEEAVTSVDEAVTTTEAKSTESKSDCDQFIKDYEEFVNSYISIIKKMKANPTDMTIMGEYTEMTSKAATMQSTAGDCTDAKYTTKLAKLATKMASAAAGM